MKRFLVALVLAVVVSACGLNPQPFPPDNPDAAGGIPDASKNNDDGSFGDAGVFLEGGGDSAPVPETDGGDDASDASDASSDAPEDVVSDSPSDVVSDAVND